MKVYSYVVATDTDFSPNPSHGYLLGRIPPEA